MNTIQRCLGLCLAVGWAIGTADLVHGLGRDSASALYGQGVHAYFAGRSNEAESCLSRALELDAHDPRFYYFRALSLLRLGRVDEARGDMLAGAAREAQQPGRFAVGGALQRVQGRHRLLLEQYRGQGRLDAATAGDDLGRARSQQVSDRDTGVLRQKVVISVDEFLRPGGPQPHSEGDEAGRAAGSLQSGGVAPPSAGDARPAPARTRDNPFRDDPGRQPSDAVPQPVPEPSVPAEAAPDTDDDPFSDL